MATGTRIAQKDSNLTILNAPSRPTILPGHARRLAPFFEKPCLIDDCDPVRVPQRLEYISAQIVAHGISIPHGTSQQMLHPIRRIIAVDFGQLPPVFALYRTEQAPQIRASTPPRLPPGKPGPNPSLHLCQR